jgi:hypothetical protein
MDPNELIDADGLIDFGEDTSDVNPGDFLEDDNDDNNTDKPDESEKFHGIEEDEEDEEDAEPIVEEEKKDPETEPEKKADTRTPEQLEQDRQAAERRREAKLQEQLQASPEFQLAKTLSDIYGKPVPEIMAQLQEAQLKKQAEAQNVPIEILRREQERDRQLAQQKQELDRLNFQMWQNRIEGEKAAISEKYPMLDEADLTTAVSYLLTELKNPELPLDRAVMALYHEKIIEGVRKAERNEALAEMSGRKKGSVPPPSNNKANDSQDALTDEEKYIAKQMGLTEAQYLKWK